MEKLPIFYQTYGLTPFGKCQYFDLINFLFLLFLKMFSLSIISSNTFFCHFFGWHKTMEILPIYDQTDVVTPLKRFQFFDFITLLFLLSTKVFFLSRVSSNTLCSHYLAEIKISKKFTIFDQNHGLTPLEKYQFVFFLRTCCFYWVRKCFLFLEYWQTHFFVIFWRK